LKSSWISTTKHRVYKFVSQIVSITSKYQRCPIYERPKSYIIYYYQTLVIPSLSIYIIILFFCFMANAYSQEYYINHSIQSRCLEKNNNIKKKPKKKYIPIDREEIVKVRCAENTLCGAFTATCRCLPFGSIKCVPSLDRNTCGNRMVYVYCIFILYNIYM